MKKIALCIGNNEYTILPKLKYAVADAIEIEKSLKQLGFDTLLKTNVSREELVKIVTEFFDRVEENDVILIYYAGHGFQIDGDNIIAPIDLDDKVKPKEMKMNGFPIAEIMNSLKEYSEKTKIIILDACRDNLSTRGGAMEFAPILAPQGSIIAFSTSPGQASKESSDKEHGIYTDTLLKYLGLPRVPIENVFKKVREDMIIETAGSQIPWEHTSMIGDFYLNADTIYDGVFYSSEALADSRYQIFKHENIKSIVYDLKSHNWPTQERGISKIYSIDYYNSSSNDLFVLGRNIYQSADGSSFATQRFIDQFVEDNRIPPQAKIHILNGMLYEIYFDSNNNIRRNFKLEYYERIVAYVEKNEFYTSKEFIVSKLCKEDGRILYIPGQNKMMEFTVILSRESEERMCIKDVIYQGRSCLDYINLFRGFDSSLSTTYIYNEIKRNIASEVVALPDYLNIEYIYEDS